MKVIKVVDERGGKLVSTFAPDEWQKEYAEGVETKPDIGYLFAYSSKDIMKARRGCDSNSQYWLAEAEVVGKVRHWDISMAHLVWRNFWRDLKLQLRRKGADYLLCNSITLIKRLN